MRPGALRRQIVIEQTAETRDNDGAIIDTWSTFATVWAEFVTPKGTVQAGDENLVGDRPVAEANRQLRIRYLSGVTPKMRVRFGTRIFNIRNIVNVGERNREMVLYVTELAS